MSAFNPLSAILDSLRATYGADAFTKALSALGAAVPPSAAAPAGKKGKKGKKGPYEKGTVPDGIREWNATVNATLNDMLENGWAPFTKTVRKTGEVVQFAGSSTEKKEVEGKGSVFVFADTGKPPIYSQALIVASQRRPKPELEEGEVPPAPKPRGRPRKSAAEAAPAESAPAESAAAQAPAAPAAAAPEQKPRGRPKGSKNKQKAPAEAAESDAESAVSTASSEQKKRGRPKGSKNKPKSAAAAAALGGGGAAAQPLPASPKLGASAPSADEGELVTVGDEEYILCDGHCYAITAEGEVGEWAGVYEEGAMKLNSNPALRPA